MARIIYGRTPLDDQARRVVPPAMHDGFTAIAGGHVGMAARLVELRRAPPEAAEVVAPGVRLGPVGDYPMWAGSARHDRFPMLGDAIHAMSPARGSGADTALLDASHLCAALTGGDADVVPAIGGYGEKGAEAAPHPVRHDTLPTHPLLASVAAPTAGGPRPSCRRPRPGARRPGPE